MNTSIENRLHNVLVSACAVAILTLPVKRSTRNIAPCHLDEIYQ